MKKWILTGAVLLTGLSAGAQDNLLPSILYLTGAADESELDESVIACYESLCARPIRLNGARRETMVSSGLFSPFQAASVEDYRARYGDILSAAELSLVDGFNAETVQALLPFLSFAPSAQKDTLPPQRAFFLRGGGQLSEQTLQSLSGIRYSQKSRDGNGISAAFRRTAGGVSGSTFSLVRSGRRGTFILGDYHARFGQGLCLWSGLDLTSPTSLSGLSKRVGGVLPSASWSGLGTFRGLSYDGASGAFIYAVSLPFEGLRARMETGEGTICLALSAHLSRLFRSGRIGTTLYGGRDRPFCVSGDFRWTFRQLHLFGEAAVRSRTPAFVGGAFFPVREHWKAGVRLRTVPTGFSGTRYGQYALFGGIEYTDGVYVPIEGKTGFGSSVLRNRLSLTGEYALLPEPQKDPRRRQIQVAGQWDGRLSPALFLSVRGVSRFRTFDPGKRIDLRAEVGRDAPGLLWKARLNTVLSEKVGVLAYVEAGRKTEKAAVWVRGTCFRADSWKDRLYCYERDLPGLFSVPACWGRGYAISAYGMVSRRLGRARLRLYGRAGWRGYFPGAEKKPGKAELKVQAQMDF